MQYELGENDASLTVETAEDRFQQQLEQGERIVGKYLDCLHLPRALGFKFRLPDVERPLDQILAVSEFPVPTSPPPRARQRAFRSPARAFGRRTAGT